jgi:hypothetical protein
MTDEQLAAQTGRTRIAVYLKRRKLGIARCSPTGSGGPRWIEEELALLGRAPDEEIAQRIGRTMTAVYRKRWELGIPNPYGRRQRPCWG